MSRFVLSEPLDYDQFSRSPGIHNGVSGHVETVVLLSHKAPDSHINVKVEFGEGEGKVPFDKITERAEKYKPKERVAYKKINSVSKYILHI